MRDAPLPSSWCDIHLKRVSRNLELALGLLPAGARFCAVMKADAYGHGIGRIVPLLLEQGIGQIGITSNAEARAVREAGFRGTLMRLRAATPVEIEAAAEDQVEEQAGSLEAALHLRRLFDEGRRKAGVHLSLNAGGMCRDGLEISGNAGKKTCLGILETIGPHVVGICTHFPTNEPLPLRQNADLFTNQVAWVCDNGGLRRSDVLVHAGSTLTLLSGAPIGTDMYRCGAILYGVLRPDLGFKPTMALKSRVVYLGDYPKGSTVGYDRDRHLTEDRRLACISVGYATGYSRCGHDLGAILIRGHRAPVMGKISMNSIVADVSEIQGIQVGDEAIIFGNQGDQMITPDDATQQFGTILPDLFSDWGRRNPRFYLP